MIRLLRLLALFSLLLLGGASEATTPSIALDGDGGEAWTFRKPVTGRVEGGDCDAIQIASSAGSVAAARQGGHFWAEAMLAEGKNEIRAICMEQGQIRAVSAPQRWIERLADVPRSSIQMEVGENGIELDGGASRPAEGRAAAITDFAWRLVPPNRAALLAKDGEPALSPAPVHGSRISLPKPRKDGLYHVGLDIRDAFGRRDQSIASFRVDNGHLRATDPDHDHPAWIDDAIVYGAVPSLFGPRGLRDITDRLDGIAALGATVLWLSPITASPPGDFGYAVTDHFHLRETLGSEADLRALVQAAHAHGIRVILDVAVNHLSEQHPYFRDAALRGEASAYHPFFMWEGAHPVHYFDWTNLENLDYGNPEVQRYAIEAFAYWLRAFDVDGFRVDASWGVKERAPEFWPRWRRELKRIKPDLLLIAEASAGDPYYGVNGFDAAYDWTDKLGEWAWHDVFGTEDVAARLRRVLALETGDAARRVLTFRFLDNNDTGARFITRYGAPATRVAAALLMTLPGIPCLYMGDEVGAPFEPYRDHAPIRWDDVQGLRAYFAGLAALRHREPALRSREITLLSTTHADKVLAYLRPGPAAGETLLVLLNFGAEPVTLSFDEAGLLDGRLIDLLGGESLPPATQGSIAVSAFSARILHRLPSG